MESGFPLEEPAARRLFLREGSALLTGQIVSLVMNVGVAPALPSPQHSLVWASAGWAAGRFGSSWNRQGLAASVHMAAQPCAVRGQTMPPVWEVHQFLAQQCQDLISQTSSPLSQNDSCTGRSADLLLPSADTSRRRHDSLPDPGTASRADRFRVQEEPSETKLTLRPPSLAAPYAPVQSWQHQPEKLIFESCGYEANYLGSMLIKDLRGTESTQDACAKMRKSTEHMKKIPTIILSITYKGVKFIDASNKNVIAEHEIRNISCAAQDPEDLCTFAYITKDLQTSHHYCHVFSTVDVNLTYEIILTLGQAFEVAYQLALQAQKSRTMAASAASMIETKSSKPVPKPRVSMRKSALEPPDSDQEAPSHASVSWIVDPKPDSKRSLSTN